MRCSPRIAIAVVALATASLAACSTGGSDGNVTARKATRGPTTTAANASSTSVAPDRSTPTTTAVPTTEARSPIAADDPLDWDGTRWDFGNVVSARRDDASVILSFDRYRVVQPNAARGARGRA